MRKIILALALLSFPVVANAQYPGQDKALKGARGVKVLIRDIGTDLQDIGLSSDTVKTDVELRLRKAGVPVLAGKEWPAGYPPSVIVVSANTLKIKDEPIFAVTIKVQLWRVVDCINGLRQNVSTWESIRGGAFGESVVRSSVREVIGDAVDEFANDYLAANPK